MKEYKHDETVIEAIQVPLKGQEFPAELTDLVSDQGWRADIRGISLPVYESTKIAAPGDWIIKGRDGRYFPMKPKVFAKLYSEV